MSKVPWIAGDEVTLSKDSSTFKKGEPLIVVSVHEYKMPSGTITRRKDLTVLCPPGRETDTTGHYWVEDEIIVAPAIPQEEVDEAIQSITLAWKGQER